MTFVRNDCRSIKRYAIFKFVTQFRLLRRECGHLWRANFHVDIQYSFMSYRHTFINCLFFYSHSTNQLRNQIVFSNYFHYSLLVWILNGAFAVEKCESWPILCFFLTPLTSGRVRSSEREWIQDDLISHLWCQRTWWRHTPLCIQFTPTQGRIIKYQIFFLQIKFVLWQINLFWIFLNLFPFTFSRPTTDGLGSWNGVDWVSIFFFKFLSFRSFFRYFFPFEFSIFYAFNF